MKKYGVIDIGTNSTRLLLCGVIKDEIVEREKYLISTRMGQGVDQNKVIGKETLERNLSALMELKEICKRSGAELISVFGTSALRDARNSYEFVQEAKERLQIDVEIISGELEAKYAFLGVTAEYQDDNIVIMDIGGGSTEFIKSSKGKLLDSISLDIGCVRLTERFIGNDPPPREEQEAIKRYVNTLLEEKLSRGDEKFTLVGIGGTATTLSSIKHSMKEYTPEKIHGSKVASADIDTILEQLVSKNDIERKKIVGLQPQRSDIIISGTIIIQSILSFYEKKEFIVSDYDNLEGALYYHRKNK